MFETIQKTQRPNWVNFVVLVLILLTNGLILSGCQDPIIQIKSKSKSTEDTNKNQPTKVEPQKSDQPLNGNTSKPNLKKNDGEDTTEDDDPE